jgi:hypothetical protein
MCDLEKQNPCTQDQWIQFHIFALAELRQNRLEEAEMMLTRGLNECPFVDQRDYFRSALRLVKLRQNQFTAVLELVDRPVSPELVGFQTALQIHVYGELRQYSAAAEASRRMPAVTSKFAVETLSELRRRYVEQSGPLQSDAWLQEQEFQYLLCCCVAA